MIVGVPKEIKNHEYRVAITPDGCAVLSEKNITIYVETQAGKGSGFTDKQYESSGAIVLDSAKAVFERSDLIVKIKEPQESEYNLIQAKHTIFTYFHFAASEKLTQAMIDSGATCIAYETVSPATGILPLLAPMSQIAGRLATQQGAYFLEKPQGGKGQLLGGVPGSPRGKVVVIGAGVVGMQAAQIAAGMQANVELLDINSSHIRSIAEYLPQNITPLVSTRSQILKSIKNADLVIGAVLIPGAKAPKVLLKKDLKILEPGSVVVDVAIDQGGCFETSKATSHENPVYIIDNILHYCVANIPGAVPKTATHAITSVTLKYIESLALNGLHNSLENYPELEKGLTIQDKKIVNNSILD